MASLKACSYKEGPSLGFGLGGGFVFEDHQGYAGEQTVFGLREVEAGDRLDALDAVGGGVDVDEELLRRRLQAVVVRQVGC